MTTRILPPEEWSKLADTEMGTALAAINPEAVTVVVAEDELGVPIGCWGLINFVHLEGLWVRQDYRGRGVPLRRLWNHICAIAASRGIGAAFTGASDAAVLKWIRKRGGVAVPFDSFVLPLKPVGRVE